MAPWVAQYTSLNKQKNNIESQTFSKPPFNQKITNYFLNLRLESEDEIFVQV